MKNKILFLSLVILILSGCTKYSDDISVEIRQPVYPVLVLKDFNPVLYLKITRHENIEYQLKKIELSLEGTTNISDIVSAKMRVINQSGQTEIVSTPIKNSVIFDINKKIDVDTLLCEVGLELKDEVNTFNTFNIRCRSIMTNLGALHVDYFDSYKNLRAGVALRKSMQDNVHTSRIPGLETSCKGTLLAIYDARRDNGEDLQGNIDIALNRSIDGGRTWLPMQIILDMGKWGGLPEKYNGVSDASILSDPFTGDIYVIGLWMHGVLDPKSGKWIENLSDTSTIWNHQWRSYGSQPGYDVKQSSQFLITKSFDDGITWSTPRNITKQVKKKNWWLLAPAPGKGIVMEDGTLVFPVEGRNEIGLQFSTIMWSKDRGENWTVGEPAYYNTNECQVVELSDHSLMLNMRERSNRRKQIGNGRAVCVTKDLGKTWIEHSTSKNALIEPACQASILRHNYYVDNQQKHVLLFVNPNSKEHRNNITMKVSFDDGCTWPEDYWILLDEGKGAGYSCMTSIDDQTIGIFYEGSQSDIQFQTIKLEEILKNN